MLVARIADTATVRQESEVKLGRRLDVSIQSGGSETRESGEIFKSASHKNMSINGRSPVFDRCNPKMSIQKGFSALARG